MHADRTTRSQSTQPALPLRDAVERLKALFPHASANKICAMLEIAGYHVRRAEILAIIAGKQIARTPKAPVLKVVPGTTRNHLGGAREPLFPHAGTAKELVGNHPEPLRVRAPRGVRSNSDPDIDQAIARANSITPDLADRENDLADSLRSSAANGEVFALEHPPAPAKPRKGKVRTPFAGPLLGPPPFTREAEDLLDRLWALCERAGVKPPGITKTAWRGKSRRCARDIVASGVTVAQAIAAWERCYRERGRPLYSIFALQGEIARQAADDRDRGGGAAGTGWTDEELDED